MSVVAGTQGLAEYLEAVRRELADLGVDEVDELTGGLEADLADALAGSEVGPEEMFGRPEAYAAELRAAAGLPPRPTRGPSEILRRGKDFQARLKEQRWWDAAAGFVADCLPLWWVFRAYVVFQLIVQQLFHVRRLRPEGWFGWSLLLVLVILSIQLGRRNWLEGNIFRRSVMGAVNVLAAASLAASALVLVPGVGLQPNLLPVVKSRTTAEYGQAYEDIAERMVQGGVFNQSHKVHNIFPYDSEGNLLQGIQLFDDRGEPLVPPIKAYYDNGATIRLVPIENSSGEKLFNVFPLKERKGKQVRDARAPALMQFPIKEAP